MGCYFDLLKLFFKEQQKVRYRLLVLLQVESAQIIKKCCGVSMKEVRVERGSFVVVYFRTRQRPES